MRSLMLVATLLAAGCGGSMFSDRIANYRSAISSLNVVVDAHANSAPAAAPSTCAAAMADYARQAGALIDRMQSMSGGMDQCMGSLGRPGDAEFGAGCASMRSELDEHAKDGCSKADLAAEMARHASAMKGQTSREMDRTGEMEGMGNGMGSSMMSGKQGCH